MSKIMNRIFKSKKNSKTLDDIQITAVAKGEAKNGSAMPRSKTTQITVANGRSPSPKPVVSPVKNSHQEAKPTSRSVPRPKEGSPNGECMSPVEIPVEEQLQLIAEDPPHVARSTPKGLVVDTSRWKEEHDMKDCIYERAVYEKMIDNSLKTCELLQTHLDSYITVVRQTPSRETTPVKSVETGANEKRKS